MSSYLPGMVGIESFLNTGELLETVSRFAQLTGYGAHVNFPGSIQKGDVAVWYNFAGAFAVAVNPTMVTPSGFSAIFNSSNDTGGGFFGNQRVCTKILTGAESGQITGVNPSGLITVANVIIIRGNAPIRSITPIDWQGHSTIGTPTPLTINADTALGPATVFAQVANTNDDGVQFTGVSPAFGETTLDGFGGSTGDQRWGFTHYAKDVVPADQTFGGNDIGSGYNNICGGALQFR